MTLTQTEKNRRTTIVALIVVLVALAVWGLSGCSSLWHATKSAAAPAGGAATGALAGSFAPPAGPIVGAALGAAIAHALFENAALRSGEVVGEGALEAELRRWRSKAQTAEFAAAVAEDSRDWAMRWRWRIVWIAVGFLVFLRRQWLWKFVTGQGVRSRFWTAVHILVAGDKTRKLAIGNNPIEKPK